MDNALLLVAIIPVLVLLMLAEAAIARWRGLRVHSAGQTLNNLFIATGQRAISSTVGFVPLGGYPWLVDRVGLLTWDTGSWLHWVAAFFAVDLAMYARHRAAHRVGFLWATHAVHHQSTEYNLTVATRLGWVQETVFVMAPLALLGMPLAMVVPLFALGNLWQFAQHTELVGRLGVLDRWLMTPSNHRVHHGRNEVYLDTNYGNITLVWDRLFGTWAPESEAPVYGTLDGLPSFDPLENNLAPWRELVRRARAQPTVLDGARVFVMPPSWRAGGTTFAPAPRPRGLLPRTLGWTVAGVTLIGAVAVTLLAARGDTVAPVTLALVLSLVLVGITLDGRWFQPTERSGRAALAAAVLTLAGASQDGPLAWLGRRLARAGGVCRVADGETGR